MTKLNKECPVCGVSFYAYRKTRKYCSRACYYASRRLLANKKGANIKCEACGKIFYVRPSYVGHRRFCSINCWVTSDESKKIVSESTKKAWAKNPKTGKLNGNWKGGITPTHRLRLTTKKWKQIKKEVLIRDCNTCQKCGNKDNLHVHHITPWRFGGSNEHNNLICLCNKCHPVEEKKAVEAIYMNAIKQKCIMCSGQRVEIKKCMVSDCPLFNVRPYQDK